MVYVIAIAIGALVGWLIGKGKGHGGLGIVLGGLLGIIGWIIVGVMKPAPDFTPPDGGPPRP